jgi:DNA-binding transcriptional MerR regulator
MSLVGIGEFARLSRLSPKALRLYHELGLLPPARVDPDSGYRWYASGQLERARLVATLRQLGIPLAEIKAIVSLDAAAAAGRIGAYWAQAEAEHAARRDLAGFLIDGLNGTRSAMYEVATREIPARHLLCLLRHVDGPPGLAALGKEFIGRFMQKPAPRIEGIAGAPFLIFYGQVTEDSNGPAEWCRPVAGDRAEETAAAYPGLVLRTEPAHGEAYVHLGTRQVPPAEWHLIAEALHAWAAEHQVQVTRQPDLGARVTYLARQPVTAESRPDCDYAVPLTAGLFG